MSSVASTVWRVASLAYGLLALCIFSFYALCDGSFFRWPSKTEKDDLALARKQLWNLLDAPNGLEHHFFKLRSGFRLHYVSNRLSDSHNLVIFLHGFPDSWAIWRPLLSGSLRRKAKLIAVDLPGYGGSDGLPEYSATAMLEAVTDFVVGMRDQYQPDSESYPSHGEEKVILVGHDWGCLIGYRLAAEAPQLATRFVLSNSFHIPLAASNAKRITAFAEQMLRRFIRQPLSSRNLPRRALTAFLPLLAQIKKSAYIFIFNLPRPLATFFGSMGNYWFLRLTHGLAAGSRHPLEGAVAAEIMASSLGPSKSEAITTDLSGTSYPSSVLRRAANGGWSEKIRLYREGLATGAWDKSLETLAELASIGESRRSSSGAGLLEDGPEGALKAKTTIVWGKRDPAIDARLAVEGIADYLAMDSQVVMLPKTGHWVPFEQNGRDVLEEVIDWSIAPTKQDLMERVSKVYEGAKVTVQK
ncbi:MAG: hypothetical protein M1819_000922 [Sarea resinae]|nr:MAG: hypothetical protein M1819_000922 [Sarea resinae]